MDETLIDSIGIWNDIDRELIKCISKTEVDSDKLQNIQDLREQKLHEYSECKDPYMEYCRFLKEKYRAELIKDVKELKPNPEVYLKTFEELKVKPEECLIFEDSLIGMEAAKSSGIDVDGVILDFERLV